LTDLIAFVQSPLGAAVIVVLSLFAPKLYTLISPWLKKFGIPAQPQAEPPTTPPGSAAIPPTSPPPCVLDSALEVLKSLARKRYMWLTEEQAVLSYASDESRRHAEETEAMLKKRVTDSAAKTAS
jgi:hypothetical protein